MVRPVTTACRTQSWFQLLSNPNLEFVTAQSFASFNLINPFEKSMQISKLIFLIIFKQIPDFRDLKTPAYHRKGQKEENWFIFIDF